MPRFPAVGLHHTHLPWIPLVPCAAAEVRRSPVRDRRQSSSEAWRSPACDHGQSSSAARLGRLARFAGEVRCTIGWGSAGAATGACAGAVVGATVGFAVRCPDTAWTLAHAGGTAGAFMGSYGLAIGEGADAEGSSAGRAAAIWTVVWVTGLGVGFACLEHQKKQKRRR